MTAEDEKWNASPVHGKENSILSKNIMNTHAAGQLPYGLTKFKINHYLTEGDPLDIIDQFNNMKDFLFNNSSTISPCEGIQEESVDEKVTGNSEIKSEECIDPFTMSRVLTEVEQRSKLRDIHFDLNQDEEDTTQKV